MPKNTLKMTMTAIILLMILSAFLLTDFLTPCTSCISRVSSCTPARTDSAASCYLFDSLARTVSVYLASAVSPASHSCHNAHESMVRESHSTLVYSIILSDLLLSNPHSVQIPLLFSFSST